LEKRVARPLSLSVEAAASGIYKLTTARMAQLIGEMTVQVGLDPRDYVLVGFGGAGPLFVAALAEEIEAARAIVPRYPAVWSAFGGLFADIVHDYAQSHFAKIAELDPATLNAIADALAGLARQDLERDELAGAEAELQYACDLRYAGQSHEITVPIAGKPPFDRNLMREVEREFEDLHEKTYAHRRPEDPRELITVRLLVRVPRRLAVPAPDLAGDAADRGPPGTRPAWFHGHDRAVETRVVDRDALPAGFRIEGPAIVEEDQSNTVVPPGMRLAVNATGELIVERSQP
jgi:N-methylhydantoinase A/oxoprolinase/acetone carboxylase beta subunit